MECEFTKLHYFHGEYIYRFLSDNIDLGWQIPLNSVKLMTYILPLIYLSLVIRWVLRYGIVRYPLLARPQWCGPCRFSRDCRKDKRNGTAWNWDWETERDSLGCLGTAWNCRKGKPFILSGRSCAMRAIPSAKPQRPLFPISLGIAKRN